jgi:predicted enzyme related to lactoylglutathione lyase
MPSAMRFTKIIVGDLDRAERFYKALGLAAFNRSLSGEDRSAQEQVWVSASGDISSHVLLLSRFLNLPEPKWPEYPGEAWLIMGDMDVDAACSAVIAHGGAIVRESKDTPEFRLRSAVVTDPDGHHIELTGPMP